MGNDATTIDGAVSELQQVETDYNDIETPEEDLVAEWDLFKAHVDALGLRPSDVAKKLGINLSVDVQEIEDFVNSVKADDNLNLSDNDFEDYDIMDDEDGFIAGYW